MTGDHGEQHEQDDDLEFLEETFVIADEEDSETDLDDVLAQVEQEVGDQSGFPAMHATGRQPGEAAPAVHGYTDEVTLEDPDESGFRVDDGEETLTPESILFASEQQDQSTQFEGYEETAAPPFMEEGAARWGGSELSAREMGIPVDGDEQDVEPHQGVPAEHAASPADEDDLFGAEPTELPAAAPRPWAAAPRAAAGSPAGSPPAFQTSSSGAPLEEPVEEDWAPIEEEHEDPIYGEASEQADAEPMVEEPTFEEYEESYVDTVPERRRLVGAGARGRRALFGALAMAAMVLVAVGGTIAALRPHWLGFGGPTPLVDRVEIARPNVDLAVELPKPQFGNPEHPDTETPTTTTPVMADPVPDTKDPVELQPPLQGPVPVMTDPDLEPANPTLTASPSIGGERISLGDNLAITTQQEPLPKHEPIKIDPRAAGLTPGNQAFAQLHNLNFFVGTVKAMDGDHITMRLQKGGEITFSYASLKALMPLTSSDYQDIQHAGHGYVMLTNRNRLFGNIIEHPKEENIILEIKSNRVMIPRASIESIGNDLPTGVKFSSEEENDEWVRKLIQDQMERTPQRPPEKSGKVKVGRDSLSQPTPAK